MSEKAAMNFTYSMLIGNESYEPKQVFRYIDLNNRIVNERNTLVLSQIEMTQGNNENYLGLILFLVIFMLGLVCRISNELINKR
jgi:hypothetical protein